MRTFGPGAEAVGVAGSSGQEAGLHLGRGAQGRQAGSELWGLCSGHTGSPSAAWCAGAAHFPAGRGLASGMSLLRLGADLKSEARPTEAVVAMSEGPPADRFLEEQTPRPSLACCSSRLRSRKWTWWLGGRKPSNLCTETSRSHGVVAAYLASQLWGLAKWWTLLSTSTCLRGPLVPDCYQEPWLLSGDSVASGSWGVTRGLRCLLSVVSRKLGPTTSMNLGVTSCNPGAAVRRTTLMAASRDPEQRDTGESGLADLCA